MASNTILNISSVEEGEIDRDRIINGDLVPEEYFCPICQYLLWKPHACSSCQHLFCEKCIRTWLKNPNSKKRCPFRCEAFEDRQCPSYIHSLLSRLNIQCRNASFGCTEVLSYDQLEHHENVQCGYLTKRCSECEQQVLQIKLAEHRETEGLCVPCPIKCTICQDYIEKCLFREHFHGCCQAKITELLERVTHDRNVQTRGLNQAAPPNYGIEFFQSVISTMQLFEQQKQMSRLPTTLKGVDAVQRAREQNCGHFYHVFIIFKFLLLNWTKIPFFVLNLALGGFFGIGTFVVGGYTILSHWVYTHIYCGPLFLILFSCIASYGTSIICQSFSDRTIIFFVGLSIFLWGCTTRVSMEMLEMSALFNQTKLCISLCCLGILIMKIILLFIRFYYWLIPTFIAVGFVTFFNFFVAFKIYRVYANALAAATTTRNEPLMTV